MKIVAISILICALAQATAWSQDADTSSTDTTPATPPPSQTQDSTPDATDPSSPATPPDSTGTPDSTSQPSGLDSEPDAAQAVQGAENIVAADVRAGKSTGQATQDAINYFNKLYKTDDSGSQDNVQLQPPQLTYPSAPTAPSLSAPTGFQFQTPQPLPNTAASPGNGSDPAISSANPEPSQGVQPNVENFSRGSTDPDLARQVSPDPTANPNSGIQVSQVNGNTSTGSTGVTDKANPAAYLNNVAAQQEALADQNKQDTQNAADDATHSATTAEIGAGGEAVRGVTKVGAAMIPGPAGKVVDWLGGVGDTIVDANKGEVGSTALDTAKTGVGVAQGVQGSVQAVSSSFNPPIPDTPTSPSVEAPSSGGVLGAADTTLNVLGAANSLKKAKDDSDNGNTTGVAQNSLDAFSQLSKAVGLDAPARVAQAASGGVQIGGAVNGIIESQQIKADVQNNLNNAAQTQKFLYQNAANLRATANLISSDACTNIFTPIQP